MKPKLNQRLRLLIAEDGMEMRDRLYKLLKNDFEIVRAVSNGRELVSVALDLRPDVIVSDTFMPLLGGLDAMSEVNMSGARIPVVLIGSAFRRAGIARHPGAAAYVDRSDLELDLVAAVRSAARGHFFYSRSIPISAP